jgi:hypothetical protein
MLRTISFELCRHPVFMDTLVADLGKRMIDFSTTGIVDQFHRLVKKPLQSLVKEIKDGGNAVVVVVDALDECGGLTGCRSQDRRDVLAAVKQWSTLSPFLKLIVTSRDETSISEVLKPISTPLELRLDSRHAIRDVEAFLERELRRIGVAHCLPDSWPAREEIRTLAKKANGLFVWAVTLVKFVDQPGAQDILQRILWGDLNVEGDITRLYELILKISFCPDQQPSSGFLSEFQKFVGAIVTANRPLEKGSSLFSIIGVETTIANYICRQLRSVMAPDAKCLRFIHQSFVDFLLSEKCPPIFRILPGVTRRNISLSVLTLLNDRLQFDPSEFSTSYRSNPKTPVHISGELAFACRIWGDNLPDFRDEELDASIVASLKTFFETKFLFWLEALSLTSQTSCALTQLLGAKQSIAVSFPDAQFS